MYEREERLIAEAERLAAETHAKISPTEKRAGDASAVSAIQRAITQFESAESTISSLYQSLKCGMPADRAEMDQRRNELLPRAWTALLLMEREKDFLINDLYRLQSESNTPSKR